MLRIETTPCARASSSPRWVAACGISCCSISTAPVASPASAKSASAGPIVPLAPGRMAMTFSPFWSTKIMAMPVAPSVARTCCSSTRSARRSLSASSAKLSDPTRANRRISDPARRAASAWFAPLPPGAEAKALPGMVSPGRGIRLTVPIRSRLVEPRTVIISVPWEWCSSCAWSRSHPSPTAGRTCPAPARAARPSAGARRGRSPSDPPAPRRNPPRRR